MNQQNIPNVQHRGLYPKLPDPPGWNIESLIELIASSNDHGHTSNIQEAACSVHESWIAWSFEAELVLTAMADRIIELDIPESYVVELVEIATQYPAKPSLPKHNRNELCWPESAIEEARQRLDIDWESWADWIKDFYERIGLIVFRFWASHAPVRFRHGSSSVHKIESLDIAGLSIAEQRSTLNVYDPRKIFRDMLELPKEGSTHKHSYRLKKTCEQTRVSRI